ncbi:MAG: cation:proton antiporter [Pirellulaceae bacterium]
MDERWLFYYLAGVPLLGILAQWLAWRLRLPAILLLLGFGVLLGLYVRPDRILAQVTGSDESVGPKLLFPVVSLAVAVILLEGGLSLKFSELKTSGRAVWRLCSIGACVSWILTTVAAWGILGLEGRLATLLGAVLVVTGPTVVIPLLRQIRPSRRVGSVLKWEGIVIDPVGAVLAVLVFEHFFVVSDSIYPSKPIVELGKTLAIGGLGGVGVAWLLACGIRRYWIPDFLHATVVLTATLGAFAVSNWLQPESGLVTVTLLGIVLGNHKDVRVHHVLEFKEHLGVLLISVLFIVLGSRLQWEDLLAVGPRGLLFLGALLVVIRPASVFLSTLRTELTWRERAFIACVAPRGIVAASVASVFALKLSALDTPVPELVPITFLVIVGTVSVYGLLAAPLARRLGLANPNPQGILFVGAEPWVHPIAAAVLSEGIAVRLVDTNYTNVAAAKMSGLPAECASILAEQTREELELSGIGRLLAVTGNDEVNMLATREFVPLFGRAQVYALPPARTGTGRRASGAVHLRGRTLFGEELHHERLADWLSHGGVIKKTQLSASFTPEDFRRRYGPSAVVLFMISEDRRLHVCTAGDGPKLRAGQTVIAIVDPSPAGPRA